MARNNQPEKEDLAVQESQDIPVDEHGLPDPIKMSKAQLEAYVLQLQNDLTTIHQQVRNPWGAARTSDGKFRVRIPAIRGNNFISINGKAYVGEMELDGETLQQVMEIYTRSVENEMRRMQFRGNMGNIEAVPIGDIASRINRAPIATL